MSTLRKSGRRPSRQAGTSLVEVLVTLVVLTIGLLGLTALQLFSAQGANSSSQRFEATVLAQDILERMRANRRQALEGAYDIDVGEAVGAGGAVGDDLVAWKAALAELPDGDGSIDTDADERVTIVIQWTDALARGPDGQQTAVVRLRSEL